MDRPRLSFWQIWNMSFGFLGIQFGWGLQMANMSAIYEYLGAKPEDIPMLWLAAPLTGLLVQPIIGHFSDRTWGPLGRRRPYFLTGALLASTALLFMPNSSSLWMAAGMLWILDASINISMEPFRAFVADLLPEEQRTRGFAMQSLFIGLGAVLASALPWILTHWFGIVAGSGGVPMAVKISFYAGAGVFLTAVLWTVFTTKEYPPENLEELRDRKSASPIQVAAEIFTAVRGMPVVMRQLALVQVVTWLGLFCMWLYFPVAVARHVFNAPDQNSRLYQEGIEWAGICFAAYSAVCFAFSLVLPRIAQAFGKRATHMMCLLCGAAGLLSVGIITDPRLLLISMVGVGIAWTSVLTMPYAILAGVIPAGRNGLYMGIFNFFIVLPEIATALGFGWIMTNVLGNNRLAAVLAGGVFFIVAALLTMRVQEPVRQPALEPLPGAVRT